MDLDDCDFLRNKMTTDFADRGGGAVFMDAAPGAEINGKWTNCRFIENSGYRGGAAYLRSCKLIEIEDCVFVANTSFRGGGALCMSDKSAHGTSIETRICNSMFISNRAEDDGATTTADNKGGAVYSRFGANTTMVNCIIAGNFSEEQGGGTCNADDGSAPSDSVLDLHNCLLIGNECDTNVVSGILDVGGGHFNRNNGLSELAHCTIVGNKAGYRYGGAANRDEFSQLKVRNSIVWNNTDVDGGSDALDAELHYDANNLNDNDVDANLIHDLDDDSDRFVVVGGATEKNQEADPVFPPSTGVTWTASTFDPDTGTTTFTVASIVGISNPNDLFFKPDSTVPQLLIKEIVTNTCIVCWGKWENLTGQDETGAILNYHITAGTSNAIDYGETVNLPGDVCDLDNDPNTDVLPKDLDGNGRDQGVDPDCGPYETGGP